MSEELIKNLEDSGYFNQTQQGVEEVPTLSELIGACGGIRDNIYFQLSCHHLDTQIKWYAAYVDKNGKLQEDLVGWGPFPEEAVAKLWLALND